MGMCYSILFRFEISIQFLNLNRLVDFFNGSSKYFVTKKAKNIEIKIVKNGDHNGKIVHLFHQLRNSLTSLSF